MKCFAEEEAGGRSYRNQMNELYREKVPSAHDLNLNGNAALDINFIDLRFGNTCNLRCRMCTPQFSKLILKDYKDIYSIDTSQPEWLSLQDLNWFKNKDFLHSLPLIAPSLEVLHIAGGEPLIIQETFEFLRNLIKLGASKKISLHYNTNLTVLPEQAKEIWSHFKSVRLIVSLDGVGELNGYIRYPSRWRDIENNLRILDEFHENYNCSYVGIHTTVQIYNVLQVRKLLEFLSTFKFIQPLPELTALEGPEQFNIQSLPASVKSIAESELLKCIPRKQDTFFEKHFVQGILAVIGHMNAKDLGEYLPVFLKATELYDQQRSTNLKDFVPELYQALSHD